MATGVQVWSQSPASNATADSNINWAEGQAPSSVNDSARAMMASVAKWNNDNTGSLITSGTSSALTVVTNQVEGALTTGFTFTATLGTAIAANATLAVDGLTATNIFTALSTASQVSTGQFPLAGQICSFMFSTSVGGLSGSVWVAKTYAQPYLTVVSNNMAANVTGVGIGSFKDGPAVTQGTTGVWLVSGNVTLSDASASNFMAKIWDGTSAAVATAGSFCVGGDFVSLALTGVATNPAGNLRISVAEYTGSGGAGIIESTSVTTVGGSSIVAVRIG